MSRSLRSRDALRRLFYLAFSFLFDCLDVWHETDLFSRKIKLLFLITRSRKLERLTAAEHKKGKTHHGISPLKAQTVAKQTFILHIYYETAAFYLAASLSVPCVCFLVSWKSSRETCTFLSSKFSLTSSAGRYVGITSNNASLAAFVFTR